MTQPPTAGADAVVVPTLSADIGQPGPVHSHFEEWDTIRERCPVFWNDVEGGGHWVLTRFDDVREALQDVDVFTTESTIVSDPDPDYLLLPLFLDPTEHLKYRQLYNARFSPGAVDRLTEQAREACRETIGTFLDEGRCDFIHDFADVFPTQVFLLAMGLPQSDAPKMVDWVRKIFLGLAGTDTAVAAEANAALTQYFVELVADRRENTLDPDTDMVTYFVQAQIDGKPISDEYLLSMLVTLVMAGLDTTKSQLGFNFHHLATHPDDRRRLLDDPSLMPAAIEEMLRAFAFVPPARKLGKDIDHKGCPMKKGQMVLMPLWSANRDGRAFDKSTDVVIDRTPNRHIAFGAGAHRCAGAHLARRELLIAIEEWHALIPDYEVDTSEPLIEHGWQVGLDALRLRWSR